MAKKLSLLMAAVAVLVFAVPAMASAAPTATNSKTGEVLKPGTAVTATGTDVTLTFATIGNLTCGHLNFTGTLTKNNDTEGVESESINQFTSAECTNKNGAVNFTEIRIHTTITASGTVKITIKFVFDLGGLTCTFNGTNVAGAYSPGTDTITFTEATGLNGGACGTAKLDGSFTMEVGSTPMNIS